MSKVEVSKAEYEQILQNNVEVIDQHFDREFTLAVGLHLLPILEQVYFRPVFVGFDEVIERNNPEHPVLLISNHSGMSFPWDALIFGGGYYKKMGFDLKKTCRAIAAPALSQTRIMNPYMIRNWWRKIGGIDATFHNFETFMRNKETNLLIYPEGVPGIGKGWNRKYQLQRFATSFVRMSLKYQTDVVPFYTINGENINPYTYSFPWVNRLSAKIGLPFLPIGLMLVFLLFFPWLFYYAWPAKLTYVRGKRLRPYEWIDKDYEELSEAEIHEIRDRIHANMQKEMDESVDVYAKKPYHIKELFSRMKKHKNWFPYYLPFGWIFLFHEFERQWKMYGDAQKIKLNTGWGSLLKMMFKNPFTLFYFIPILGWIGILWKGYKGGIKEAPVRYMVKSE